MEMSWCPGLRQRLELLYSAKSAKSAQSALRLPKAFIKSEHESKNVERQCLGPRLQ